MLLISGICYSYRKLINATIVVMIKKGTGRTCIELFGALGRNANFSEYFLQR